MIWKERVNEKDPMLVKYIYILKFPTERKGEKRWSFEVILGSIVAYWVSLFFGEVVGEFEIRKTSLLTSNLN